MLHEIVFPVFLIIFIGIIIGKLNKGINVDALVFFIVYVTAPSLIFTSLSKSSIKLQEFFIIFIATSLIVLISGFLIYLFFKFRKITHNGLYLPMTMGNTGYLGYPISMNAFGSEGLSRAIIYDNAMALFLFSIGIYIVHEKNEIKEVFRLPLIYALIFGILFNALRIDLPNIIFKPLEMVGGITIPLALMVLGYRLSSIKITHLKIAFFASIFKILGGFLIASLVVSFLPLNQLTKSVILIQASMPSAVMSMILCQKYKKDPEIVTSVVMLSTLMSVVGIPVILAIIR